MKSILITGCNRGIGYGLVKHLKEKYQNVNHIFATYRNPDKAQELLALKECSKNIHVLQADLTIETEIKKIADEVSSTLNGQGLDVLINNAGVSSKFTRLQLVKHSDLINHFEINTISPIMLTKALISSLMKGQNQNTNGGIVVNMSSVLGSIHENNIGGFYPYRTSKTALNAATRSMSFDLKAQKIVAVSLHPGWVKTDMGGPNAPMSVETSVKHIIRFIQEITPEYSGLFYDATTGKQIA